MAIFGASDSTSNHACERCVGPVLSGTSTHTVIATQFNVTLVGLFQGFFTAHFRKLYDESHCNALPIAASIPRKW
jgi:hypothetical protein